MGPKWTIQEIEIFLQSDFFVFFLLKTPFFKKNIEFRQVGLNELEIEKELRAAGFNRTARNVHSIYLKVGFFWFLVVLWDLF